MPSSSARAASARRRLCAGAGRRAHPGAGRAAEPRPGVEQGGHRRHPRHPLRPGQDPPEPAQPGYPSTWKETYGDDIEWNTGGYVFVAYREREENILKELLVIQKSFGLNIDWLDREAMLDRSPT